MILPKAAQLVNVHEGLSSVLVILFSQISRSFCGCFKVILFSEAAFVSGLGMLWYESSHPSVGMLIGAVVLLTVGKAARDVPLKAFLADQLRRLNLEQDQELVENRAEFWWRFCWILGIFGAIMSTAEWEVLSKMSCLAMVAGSFWFLLGMPYYVYEEPSPCSPLRCVIMVVKAALSKRHLNYPVSSNQLFQNDTEDAELLPRVAFLRWLDKAATLESSPCPGLTEQQIAGRLFEVAKVRNVKNLLKMLPMWLTFILYSLVEATGSTFFIEQAEQRDDQIAKRSHPATVNFVMLENFTSFSISMIYRYLSKNANQRHRPLLKSICFGMLCSILCCLTAWRIEVYRLSNLELRRIDNRIDTYVDHISGNWLTPQFFFLGLMDGFATRGLQHFFESQVCESMKDYGPELNKLPLGIGKFVSAICILIFRSWFSNNLNTSRLDKYYVMLLVPASLNFVTCCLVSYWYWNQPNDTKILDDAQELEIRLES